MITILIDAAGFLLLAFSFVSAAMQLTFKPAPLKRNLGRRDVPLFFGKE